MTINNVYMREARIGAVRGCPEGAGGVLRRALAGLALLAGLSVSALAQGVITQTEPDDSFSTANATGLTGGSSGIKVAYGHSFDGDYGETGDFSGDFDFFRLTANAGQVISVDLKNNSTNDDFDSFIGVYGPAGTVVASNDDAIGRASKLSYTATATGTYYVVASNWINVADPPGGSGSLPTDPNTPGTGLGPPGGTGGPYQIFIGLDANVPIVQFDSLTSANPVPIPYWGRTTGQVGFTQSSVVGLANTGNVGWTITGYAITGPDAAKFSVQGLATPLTIGPNQISNITLVYQGDGVQPTSTAGLDFTSNDPLDIKLALNTHDVLVTGGGSFTVRQVHATAGTVVNNFEVADALLAGTNAATTATETNPVVNYANGGQAQGYFGNDRAFPDTAGNGSNFATQATGTFFVRKDGYYTFRGMADDGQRLRVDGQDVFQSFQANTPALGFLELTAGPHTIEYTQFEIGGGDQMELSIAQTQGEFFLVSETTWELLEAYSGDSDGDGLPNQWEADNGLDQNIGTGDDGANGDPDGDGLLNSVEYAKGTKPKDDDTDDDLLKDGWENDTGTWGSASLTGTDPLDSDSDNDGFLDSEEDPSEAWTGFSQPGTDPNKLDTDGDGHADRVEVAFSSNPKLAGSVPVFSYTPLLTDNFDGANLNSTYAFTNSGGTFVPVVSASGVAANGQAVQITDAVGSANNSIAWNRVASGATQAVRLSFDFRMGSTNPADGVGIGLFRTSAYGETGGSNPAAPDKNWENPSANNGFANALSFGFSIYGANYIRMVGPATPGVPLVQQLSPFTLSSNLFHRAVITAVTNGPGSTMVSMDVIQDVNGTAVTHSIFKNVMVPGFDLPNETFRLIAGGRTGGLYVRQDLDNINLSVVSSGAITPTISISKVGGQHVITYTGVLQSSGNLSSFTDVVGASSPYTVPGGSPGKMFYRAR
jgi:hypothetical protein